MYHFSCRNCFCSTQMYSLAAQNFLVKVCKREKICERSEQLFLKTCVNLCQKCMKLRQFFNFDGGQPSFSSAAAAAARKINCSAAAAAKLFSKKSAAAANHRRLLTLFQSVGIFHEFTNNVVLCSLFLSKTIASLQNNVTWIFAYFALTTTSRPMKIP